LFISRRPDEISGNESNSGSKNQENQGDNDFS